MPAAIVQRSMIRHVACIHGAADQHSHAAAQQDAERTAEDSDQTAYQPAGEGVVARRRTVYKTVHDVERAVLLLHDHSL